MGTYYKHHIKLTKKDNSEIRVEDINFLSKLIEKGIDDDYKSFGYKEGIIEKVLRQELIDYDKSKNNCSVDEHTFATITNDTEYHYNCVLYMQFTFKSFHLLDIKTHMSVAERKKYSLDIIVYENTHRTDLSYEPIYDEINTLKDKNYKLIELLITISQNNTLSSEILQLLINCQELEVLRALLKSQTISRENFIKIMNKQYSFDETADYRQRQNYQLCS